MNSARRASSLLSSVACKPAHGAESSGSWFELCLHRRRPLPLWQVAEYCHDRVTGLRDELLQNEMRSEVAPSNRLKSFDHTCDPTATRDRQRSGTRQQQERDLRQERKALVEAGLHSPRANPSIIGMTPRPAAAAAASTAKSELVQTTSNFRPLARSAPVAAS